ncbi:hypothetical protein IW261DRAFT_1440672 [Armillaria novae-zelandiae]|uniref:Uncharacterized protein n=1 Tax=Armillaria novae-zelandiae TaxID=153914 RepID=A0AA39PQF3_9AGAR|nr:hypothetical protein IW261DRAFT_1440672 [Armillaria novae-zelandiae]
MVVNKKAQVGPGMASRTNSSQPLPRKKVSASPLGRPATPPPPLEPVPAPKKKAKPKKKGVKKRGWAFTDRVLALFLAVFVAYALRVCPSDYGLQDPVCWGLAKYRTNVVDAYLAPPVRRVVGHPMVRPVVEKGAAVLTPLVRRTVRGVEEFVEPRYRAYLKPYVDPITKYASVATPYVRKAYATVSPYVRGAYTAVAPYVQKAYGFGRPRVVGAYRVCVRRLGELRREFVDPHVGKMWIKVVELSRGHAEHVPTSDPAPSDPVPTSTPEPITTPSEEPSTTFEEPVSTSSEPAPTATPSEDSSTKETPMSWTADPSTKESISTLSEPAPTATPSEEPSTKEIPTSSTTFEEPIPTLSESATSSAEPITSPATEDNEYDDFLADLGIDFDSADTPAPNTPTPTSASSFTPPTETTRDHAAIASKRANITARHTAWAAQLDSFALDRAAAVRANLSRIRSRAAAALFGQALDDADTDFVGGVHVSRLLAGFVDEAERLVGGLEGWWRKAPKDGERERGEKVLARVEEKLAVLVREMGERVEKWAVRVREDEVRECVVASRQVKALAEKAQADLGLDYAWLEDVTYEDWQRYHDLMRVYTDFDTQIRQLQNNTHARPLGDTVLIALEAKQHDMQDAITGFVSRVASIREDMKQLDALLVGKSKEQVEQAFEQAEAVSQTEATHAETQAAPTPSKRSVGAKKHAMPVAPQKPNPPQLSILPVGQPIVGEMTDEEVSYAKGDHRDPADL